MSSKRLNELLNTPNIHVDDEDAILGELWLRDAVEAPYDSLWKERLLQVAECVYTNKDKHGIPNHLFYGTPGEPCTVCGEKHPPCHDWLSAITPEEMVQLENLPNGEPFEDVGGYCQRAGR